MRCAVYIQNGNRPKEHCPGLCERCWRNVQAGDYGGHKGKLISTMIKFKPTQNRVLFERVYPEAPKGVIASTTPDIPLECRVLAVGPLCQDVKAGMIVLIPRSEGMSVKGVTGLLCREVAVMAIVGGA